MQEAIEQRRLEEMIFEVVRDCRSPSIEETLTNPENNYVQPLFLNDKWWAAALKLIFHSALVIGRRDDLYGYSFRYCFADTPDAIRAMLSWVHDGCEGEPLNWTKRHGPIMPEGIIGHVDVAKTVRPVRHPDSKHGDI